MSSPTPAPTNIFYLIDDWNDAVGGGSGSPVSACFIAPTVAAAQNVGLIFATALQVGVRLVNKFASGVGPAFTAIAPGPPNVAITACPSGVIFAGPVG